MFFVTFSPHRYFLLSFSSPSLPLFYYFFLMNLKKITLLFFLLFFLQFFSGMSCLCLEAGNKEWSTKGETRNSPLSLRECTEHTKHFSSYRKGEVISPKTPGGSEISRSYLCICCQLLVPKLWQNSCLSHECGLFPGHNILYCLILLQLLTL